MIDLREILLCAEKLGATTIHLRAKEVPIFRVVDHLVRHECAPIEPAELDGLVRGLLDDRQQDAYERDGDVHFLYHDDKATYKANCFQLIDGHGLVLEPIRNEHPSLDELGLPRYLDDFLALRSGLVLLTGPIGCGKTTTQSALIHTLNCEREIHVLTVEDPIEQVHEDGTCLIQQLEVGQHVESMAHGIDLARRIRPDLLFVSEILDAATVDAVLSSAASGLLVVASVHASSATQAMAKLEQFFPSDERDNIRFRIAEVLRVVACQVLVHKQYGTGRVPVFEVLTNTEEVHRELEAGRYDRLRAIMAKNRGLGMCSLDDALYELVLHNRVLVDEAMNYAVDKERFEACRKLPQLS
ncbi:MAG: Flp pilus assembly complex ATPase component TadA [Planctomycetes bacterium]|nr:Flp pilus assembly complex ATPase component TadA [Planctomycetota bacterium]